MKLPNNVNPQDFQDLNTHIHLQVKQMIWDKKLAPGSKIRQEHLAQLLGISRTPLIKILQRLTSENLVEYVPRRGFYVKRLTLEEMIEIFSVREVVEGVAARTVAEHATDQEILDLKAYFAPFGKDWTPEKIEAYLQADQNFHARMVEIAGNHLIMQINEMFNIYWFSYQKGLIRHPSETLIEHLRVLDAIEHRAPRAAQELAMLHIENSRKNMNRIYAQKNMLNGLSE
ncbi:MAG: GntR family transcriptional regulator [Bacteroidota bacterium]